MSCAYIACSVHTGATCTLVDVNVTVSTSVARSTRTLIISNLILREGRRIKVEREEGRREEGRRIEEGGGGKGGGRERDEDVNVMLQLTLGALQ